MAKSPKITSNNALKNDMIKSCIPSRWYEPHIIYTFLAIFYNDNKMRSFAPRLISTFLIPSSYTNYLTFDFYSF